MWKAPSSHFHTSESIEMYSTTERRLSELSIVFREISLTPPINGSTTCHLSAVFHNSSCRPSNQTSPHPSWPPPWWHADLRWHLLIVRANTSLPVTKCIHKTIRGSDVTYTDQPPTTLVNVFSAHDSIRVYIARRRHKNDNAHYVPFVL